MLERTFCTKVAGLAAGTTTTFTTANAIDYCIDGEGYTLAAQTNAATPTTDVNTGAAFVGVAANKGSIFVFGANAAGSVKVAQGTIEDLDSGGNFVRAPEYPPLPADFCPFGELIVQVGSSGSTWTFGSSNQSGATGVTYTRNNLMMLKSRPHLS
jgi:hypothetical protein